MIKFKKVHFNGEGDVLETGTSQYIYLFRDFDDIDYAEDFFACNVFFTRLFLKNGKSFVVDKKEFNEILYLKRS